MPTWEPDSQYLRNEAIIRDEREHRKYVDRQLLKEERIKEAARPKEHRLDCV